MERRRKKYVSVVPPSIRAHYDIVNATGSQGAPRECGYQLRDWSIAGEVDVPYSWVWEQGLALLCQPHRWRPLGHDHFNIWAAAIVRVYFVLLNAIYHWQPFSATRFWPRHTNKAAPSLEIWRCKCGKAWWWASTANFDPSMSCCCSEGSGYPACHFLITNNPFPCPWYDEDVPGSTSSSASGCRPCIYTCFDSCCPDSIW